MVIKRQVSRAHFENSRIDRNMIEKTQQEERKNWGKSNRHNYSESSLKKIVNIILRTNERKNERPNAHTQKTNEWTSERTSKSTSEQYLVWVIDICQLEWPCHILVRCVVNLVKRKIKLMMNDSIVFDIVRFSPICQDVTVIMAVLKVIAQTPWQLKQSLLIALDRACCSFWR